MASNYRQESLRKIRTFSDLLSLKHSSQLDNEGLSKLKTIQKAAERMQELIKDILIFSKVSNEKENLFLKTNINQLVTKVLEDLDAQVKDKKARDSVGLLPNLIINPVLIKSLFLNLIGKAIKYSKKNVPPYKQITAEIPQSAPFPTNKKVNNFCRTIIKDNGIGF